MALITKSPKAFRKGTSEGFIVHVEIYVFTICLVLFKFNVHIMSSFTTS